MSGEAIRREDALRARSRSFRALVDRTYADLSERLSEMRSPYVAVSGGKDSLVALAIASDIRPGIGAMWSDDELEWSGQRDAMVHMCAVTRTVLRSKTCAPSIRHAGWFHPWTGASRWRDPDPETEITIETTEVWAARYGFDAVLTGLRAQESLARRAHVRRRGTAYERLDRTIVLQPLAAWSLQDVWAFIAERGLPYHPLYDVMSRGGVPRDMQRIGPLCLTPRWIMATIDPTLPARLEARYGHHW